MSEYRSPGDRAPTKLQQPPVGAHSVSENHSPGDRAPTKLQQPPVGAHSVSELSFARRPGSYIITTTTCRSSLRERKTFARRPGSHRPNPHRPGSYKTRRQLRGSQSLLITLSFAFFHPTHASQASQEQPGSGR